ncbi:Calcium-dependent cell adhesion molecule [Metarhizium guizhouense ARSEF 977]|uniref:Calcium-dependent cell adhesion molecule n=1 Tax=Metarhizium guizhouense (strain ARSEF 977) TaxID=1276136 RepID=A0A0B4G5P4_METGA|nr:Calcium-dependent cell adhesion molecule [Metarhizium guizhouense ARSEF 977]
MASAETVDFYSEENYKGTKTSCTVGQVQHLVLNTQYHSFQMGIGGGLLVWAENNPVPTVQWHSSKSSFLGEEKKYECFEVLATGEKPTFVIGVKFKDATKAPDGQYQLLVKCANLGEVKLLSNKLDKFTPVGTMPWEGSTVTTAVYVRNLKTGAYVATGSIYFALDPQEQKVVIKSEDNWPKQLEHSQSGASDFIITLKSTDK